MQLVIDIDENLYTRLFDNGDEYIADMHRACVAIRKGTPLPKGHGRLIDADKLHHCECKGNFSECDTCLDDYLCNLVNDAPTIIEADRGEE